MAEVVKNSPDLVVEIERDGRVVRRDCHLVGLWHGEAHLDSEKWIEPGVEVSIHFRLVSLAGTILYCKATSGGYRVSVQIGKDAEHGRREPRFPILMEGIARILGHAEAIVTNGLLTDISRSGLGINLDIAVGIGSMICFETGQFVLAGEVRHCRRESEGNYKVGLVISDIFTGEKRLPDSSRVLGMLRRGLRSPLAKQ
jgi:hypothetical protein